MRAPVLGVSGRLFLPQTVICIRLHNIRLSVCRLLVCDDGLYDHGGSFHPRRVYGTDLCLRQHDYDRRDPFQAKGRGHGLLRIDDQSSHVFGSLGGGRAIRPAWVLLDHRCRFGDRVGRDRLRRADPLSETGESASSGLLVGSFYLGKALPAALAYLLVAIPYGMLLSFVVLYGKEIEVPDPGYFFIFMAIGVGTARLISGRLVDHGKIHVVSIVSLVSLAISFSVFATVHTSFVFFACALAIGIGFGVSVPAFQCLFVNVAPHHMRGTATSTYLTSFDFGMGIGMLSAGFIATHTNLATAYGVGAVCCLLSLFVYIRLVKASYERNKLIS